MSKCVNCLKEINEKEVFCLTCHEEVLECAKNQITDLEAKLAELREQIAIRDEENGKIFMQSVNAMRENVELKQQLAITEKALELACQTLYDINFKLYNTEMDFKEYYKQQALTHQHENKEMK